MFFSSLNFFFRYNLSLLDLHSFPTRRSSDLLCAQRTAEISVVLRRIVARRRSAALERVFRVERRGVAHHPELSVELVRSRPGQNLYAPVAQFVVLRRERVLIDANLANRSLRRELSCGKSININLSAVRSGRWSRQRLQFGLQLIRIVRKRLEILPFHHDRANIVRGIHIRSEE